MQNGGNEKKKNFFEFIDEFFNRDLKDFGQDMREFGKEFKKEFKHGWGYDWVRTYPLLNVIETQNDYRVELAVPGLQKENFKISLKENQLKISADLEHTLKEGEKFRKREFNFGKFQRSFTLPEDVVEDKIEAKYEQGILIINLPKKVTQTPNDEREINIS
jgi:HSP20 family protein